MKLELQIKKHVFRALRKFAPQHFVLFGSRQQHTKQTHRISP